MVSLSEDKLDLWANYVTTHQKEHPKLLQGAANLDLLYHFMSDETEVTK